jgi:hypothetical protein
MGMSNSELLSVIHVLTVERWTCIADCPQMGQVRREVTTHTSQTPTFADLHSTKGCPKDRQSRLSWVVYTRVSSCVPSPRAADISLESYIARARTSLCLSTQLDNTQDTDMLV